MRRLRLTLRRARKARGGFVLLEVIVSLVILGISVATLMRSFTISMSAIRKNDITTQACVLADSMIQSFELNPPRAKQTSGSFEEAGYPHFFWTAEYTEEPIKYKYLKTKDKVENMRPLRHLSLTIRYDDQKYRKFNVIETELYLPPIEKFGYQSKLLNELFLEEQY